MICCAHVFPPPLQLQYGCSILRYRAAGTTEPACTSELDFFGGAEVSNAVRRLASLQHALQATEDARLSRPVRGVPRRGVG